ncbi:MAG: response regulator, partial [Chloroflexi bacterium]|nr:response regulator [Chloroflexota bacterium]
MLDSARALSSAHYGIITLFGDSGDVAAYLVSGLSAEEARALEAEPEGPRFIEHVRSRANPLRVADFARHADSVGLADLRLPTEVSAFMACPIRHRGESLGIIHLAHSEAGREFTLEDEETLVTFASEAALVIANARRYRDEQRARRDLEALVSTAPVGVAVFDARTGTLVSVNREARRIVSVLQGPGEQAEHLLQHLSVRRADGRELSLREFTMPQALKGAETIRAEEIVLYVPGGNSVATLMNATPIHSAEGEGELVSLVVTLQDLTPLEDLDRLRTEFLGMVSHELQVPLTSIKGSTTALLKDSNDLDPAEVRQFVRIIDSQADHMSILMADLLDVARIETGTLSVSPEPVDVGRMVDEAKNRFLISRRHNELQIQLAPDLPPVMADARRVVQVIVNLLSNAARYSPELAPIGVLAESDGNYVSIAVVDDGVGLASDDVPQVFRKYSRLDDQSRRGSQTGSGLGLAICRGIVEAHGGRIRAESDGPGMGSRFTFTLPVAAGALAVATPSPPAVHPPDTDRARILAVDDDPQALRYVREILARAGYSPFVAVDADAALEVMREQTPNLVLLDLMLPDVDGIELMGRILDIAEVPVIFLSVYGQDDYVVRAFDMGATDYIVKPFSPSELGARIRSALRRRRPGEPPEPRASYVHGDLVLDFAERRATVAGRPVELTPTEYRLLAVLAANAGRVITHGQLLERVWGSAYSASTAPVRNIVSRLRRKLDDDASDPTYIFNESRVGYR